MTQRGDYYLMLPSSPVASGGLKWSATFDEIEDDSGQLVIFFGELEAVLGGVFASPPVPPFLSVLQGLQTLRCETRHSSQFAPLREAYRRNQKAESVTRHLGLLIAELCRPYPPALNPPDWPQLQLALSRLRSDGQKHAPEYAVLPVTTADEFAELVGQQVQKYDSDTLDHYLKYGSVPTDAGNKLASEVDSLPRTVDAVLALARGRPRLVGAALLSPLLDAALTLPARRRSSEALPLGGYADVTTRGDPDRLLLSQFALDPDDFVRRFAERELLYYKREEPHAPMPPERLIVLDQGVRTWGGVRLALAAAALTLVKHNPRKGPVPQLFMTSRDQGVPISSRQVEDLAKALEASDFTKNPAELLARVCDVPNAGAPRDILLLTHPRSAAESEVIAVAKACRATDRLFVLAVNDDGASVLSEWTARGPVPVRSFHVDLVAAEDAVPEKGSAAPVPIGTTFDYQPWTGDVEPVPFPFRPGLVELPELLGFDATGERLVATTRSGIPHAIDTTDGSVEVLPRGMVDGELMKTVFAILPVNGGVVICGTMLLRKNEPYHLSNETAITITTSMVFDASATIPVTDSGTAAMYHHVAAHYDWVSRTVHVFDFGPFTQTPNWVAYPDLHSVVLLNGSEKCPIALDLSTSKRGGLFEWTGRVGEARGRNGQGSAAPKNVQLIKDSITLKIDELFLHHAKGILLLDQNWSSIQWEKFEPTEDGQPVLDGATIHRAQFANNVLAIAMTKGKQPELRLFRGPDPTALGVVPLDDRSKLFTLSPDGQKLAWMRDRRELVVAETSRLPHVLATARHAGLHNQLEIDCDAFQFQLRIGIGQFQHHFGVGSSDSFHILNFKPDPIKKMTGNSGHRTVNRKLPAGYDRNRFTVIGVTNGDAFRVIGDRHGQVILLNRLDELLVVFLIRREKAAAWTPEGGFWGDPELIGGPSSPTSAGAIATVIRAAMEAS